MAQVKHEVELALLLEDIEAGKPVYRSDGYRAFGPRWYDQPRKKKRKVKAQPAKAEPRADRLLRERWERLAEPALLTERQAMNRTTTIAYKEGWRHGTRSALGWADSVCGKLCDCDTYVGGQCLACKVYAQMEHKAKHGKAPRQPPQPKVRGET